MAKESHQQRVQKVAQGLKQPEVFFGAVGMDAVSPRKKRYSHFYLTKTVTTEEQNNEK